MGNNLKYLRERRKWTQQAAADAFGMSKSGYEKVERSERKLDSDKLERASAIYKVPKSLILGDDAPTLVVGEVLRRGVVHFFSANEGGGRIAPRPDGAKASTVALLVVDSDALPNVADENWFIYYDGLEVGMPEDFIGKLCVVNLSSGEVRICRPFHSKDPGFYDIKPIGSASIRNVSIATSGKITWMKPD